MGGWVGEGEREAGGGRGAGGGWRGGRGRGASERGEGGGEGGRKGGGRGQVDNINSTLCKALGGATGESALVGLTPDTTMCVNGDVSLLHSVT